ncbi:MAG: hypothetical protein GXY58_02755 [Planctomycetaceae bacterium]|nr:hypothetical protein [Planctomycetaceae bacterium]
MDITLLGLTSPAALAAVALLGYIVGRRRRRVAFSSDPLPQLLADTNAVIARIESISNQLRQTMASHHSTVNRCREQIRVLSEGHGPDGDAARHVHLQALLAPTDRLSHDIALAYDELRQQICVLARLRTR